MNVSGGSPIISLLFWAFFMMLSALGRLHGDVRSPRFRRPSVGGISVSTKLFHTYFNNEMSNKTAGTRISQKTLLLLTYPSTI